METDPFRLQRFLEAQSPVFDAIQAELENGRKVTHWMWYVFPQMRGLGQSEKALFYSIGSLDEAQAYLAHPVLGPRLAASTLAVLRHPHLTLRGIFGTPDDLKFVSSMTLFEAAGGDDLFAAALDHFCGGRRDLSTLRLLGG